MGAPWGCTMAGEMPSERKHRVSSQGRRQQTVGAWLSDPRPRQGKRTQHEKEGLRGRGIKHTGRVCGNCGDTTEDTGKCPSGTAPRQHAQRFMPWATRSPNSCSKWSFPYCLLSRGTLLAAGTLSTCCRWWAVLLFYRRC